MSLTYTLSWTQPQSEGFIVHHYNIKCVELTIDGSSRLIFDAASQGTSLEMDLSVRPYNKITLDHTYTVTIIACTEDLTILSRPLTKEVTFSEDGLTISV